MGGFSLPWGGSLCPGGSHRTQRGAVEPVWGRGGGRLFFPYLIDGSFGQIEADGAAQHGMQPLFQLAAPRRPLRPPRSAPRRPQTFLRRRVRFGSRLPVRPNPSRRSSSSAAASSFFSVPRFTRSNGRTRSRRLRGGGGCRTRPGLAFLRRRHRFNRFSRPPQPPPSWPPPASGFLSFRPMESRGRRGEEKG